MGRTLKVSLVILAVVAVAVRFQVRWILDPIRRFNRRFYNRFALVFAGERDTPYSVIRHVGRRSGTSYETPVVATPVSGGYIIALPYGAATDWLRNLQAAGQGKIFTGGAEFHVGAPEVIDQWEAFMLLPETVRRVSTILGISQFVKLKVRDAPMSSIDHAKGEKTPAAM